MQISVRQDYSPQWQIPGWSLRVKTHSYHRKKRVLSIMRRLILYYGFIRNITYVIVILLEYKL